jgi:aminomethyltransferase
MAHKIEQTAYQAAREGAAVSELTGWGWLRLTGRDRLDLLHRLSTNAVKNLAPGAGAVTVLTSPVGRVMAVVNAYAGENEAYLRTMPPQAAGVTRYLSSMIFWQDQVEVTNLAEQRGQLALYGPQARDTLERLTGADLAGVPEYGWSSAAISGAAVALLRGGPLEPAAWIVVAPVDAVDAIRQAFAGLPALDPQTVEVLRVEAGLPLWGRELNDDVTPLETGLLPAINFNKGCYTGQEVIARQTNYDKVTRNLVGLELDLFPGAPLLRFELAAPVDRGPGACDTGGVPPRRLDVGEVVACDRPEDRAGIRPVERELRGIRREIAHL